MKRTLQIHRNFEEADQADRDDYARLGPEQCLDILLELRARHEARFAQEATPAEALTGRRSARIRRVVQLTRR